MASSVASASTGDGAAVVQLQIAYRGQSHDIEAASSKTLFDLQEQIADLTHVDATHQKLLGPVSLRSALGKAKDNGDKTLQELGFFLAALRPSIKLMVVGPTSEELSQVQKVDAEAEKRNRPRQYHPSMLRGGKPRNTSKPGIGSPFHSLKVHPMSSPSSPEYSEIMSRLQKLSTDPAVIHVCQQHGFQVGELTELLPHEHPNLLGLNENMGQRISLRLRTQNYEGLIAYREVRKVLLHELAHNKVNDHPPEFKILNSELNAQVEAYERQVRQGTNYLSDLDVYVPPEENVVGHDSVQETAHVLGGAGASHVEDGDLQSKRQKVLLATMKRLEKQEAEIEKGCGSAA